MPSLPGSNQCGSGGSTSKFSGTPSSPQSRCDSGEGGGILSHLDMGDETGSSVAGGCSTVINMLSDTVRPVESVTIMPTLYVPASANVCKTVCSLLSLLPSPKSQL